MYVPEFWVGVAATLMVEVAMLITAAIWMASKGAKK